MSGKEERLVVAVTIGGSGAVDLVAGGVGVLFAFVRVITIAIMTGKEEGFFVAVVIEGGGAADLVSDGIGVTLWLFAQSLSPSYPGWHHFCHAVEHTVHYEDG